MSRTTIRAGIVEPKTRRGAAKPSRRGSQTSQSARQEAPQRLGGPGRAVHPWRPSISAALDLQEYSSSRGRVGWPRTSGQLPHGGCFASWTGLQSAGRKTREGASHPDRNAQFEHISKKVRTFQTQQQPVVSVDTKKKELVGDFRNVGLEWRPKGRRTRLRVHDFKDKELGKAIPYGIYDITNNEGWVSVGIDHDGAVRDCDAEALVAQDGDSRV